MFKIEHTRVVIRVRKSTYCDDCMSLYSCFHVLTILMENTTTRTKRKVLGRYTDFVVAVVVVLVVVTGSISLVVCDVGP